jgi:hypothetical protein
MDKDQSWKSVAGFLLLSWLCISVGVAQAQTAHPTLNNELYRVRMLSDGAVEVVSKDGSARRFAPVFTVMSSAGDPQLKHQEMPNKVENMSMPSWRSARGDGQTWDFFEAADVTTISAGKGELIPGSWQWSFPPTPRFKLEATLSLAAGKNEPKIVFRFTPKEEGWYSIGYTGAPEVKAGELDEVWQPLIWQEKRFPRMSFFSTEHMCPIPATLATSRGVTVGVAADPDESPFRLPGRENSRFGVLVRNRAGNAQPMAFAPVLGRAASRMKAGEVFEFTLRLYVGAGATFEAYKHLARNLYGFRDYRENATCSLNETLENMIAYAMNDLYSGWVADLRGFDYTTDVEKTVKVVSALHPLSVALLTDDEEIYRRRALPIIEYLMSRQKYLFSLVEAERDQSPSHYLKGPAVEISELAALHLMSQGRSAVFSHYALALLDKPRALNLEVVSEGASWQSMLGLYRMTGDIQYLNRAKEGANRYLSERISKLQTDFSQINPQTGWEFWVDYTPKWIDLLELYEETREKRYLDAAVAGAKLYANYVWLQPRIPPSNVTVNKGGQTIMGWTRHNPNPQPITVPEQSVPAWRVSQIGLTPEASSTFELNPAVFLTHYAAHFLRIGHYTGDQFFRDIARSAVVGRYANFPGYDINGEYTTLYSRPDYPLRPWEQLTYNNIYYNHVWPHIALLTDYLLTEAFTRSQGRIDFPPRYAEGYAYLKSKVYGDRAGRFYDDENVRVWLPAKLLRADDIQANYVAGYGNGNFYLALLNQSAQPINVKISLNPDVAPFDEMKTYQARLWQDNKAAAPVTVRGGELSAPILARGITAVAIDGLRITPIFQAKVFAADVEKGTAKLSSSSHGEITTPFGKVTGMLISFGQSLTSGYVWLEATEKELKEARLHFRLGGEWKEVIDTQYPFEFSLPLPDKEQGFEFWVEAFKTDSNRERSKTVELKR